MKPQPVLAGEAVERQTETRNIPKLCLECHRRHRQYQIRLHFSFEVIGLCSIVEPM